MDDISFKDIIKYQNKIVELKDVIKDIISFNENGCRKIKPEHFLSGEVAAYKFLNSWVKRMTKGEFIIDADVIRVLNDIDNLVYWSTKGDFSKEGIINTYEEYSTMIWMDLLSEKDIAPSIEFNAQIVAIAALSLMEKGIPDEMNHYLIYEYQDLLDGSAIGEAYSVAHEWLLSKPRYWLNQFMEDTEIYRYHFDVLN